MKVMKSQIVGRIYETRLNFMDSGKQKISNTKREKTNKDKTKTLKN